MTRFERQLYDTLSCVLDAWEDSLPGNRANPIEMVRARALLHQVSLENSSHAGALKLPIRISSREMLRWIAYVEQSGYEVEHKGTTAGEVWMAPGLPGWGLTTPIAERLWSTTPKECYVYIRIPRNESALKRGD